MWRIYIRIVRLNNVIKNTSVSRSSIYKYISADKFPKPVYLSQRVATWVESKIDMRLFSKVTNRDVNGS